MDSVESRPISNRLIDRLAIRDRKRFLQLCEHVDLKFGSILCEPGVRYEYLYFPLGCFVSLVDRIDHHPALELGLIGNEGMVGATLTLGITQAPLRAQVQGAGSALRIGRVALQKAMQDIPALSAVLMRYLYVQIAQLAQVAACNHFHEVEARLARWLLMLHDRAHGDHIHLTQQFLADMLGVQRSAVTIAAGTLQGRDLIRYSRGDIQILSRDGLEASACACYGAIVADYTERFGAA